MHLPRHFPLRCSQVGYVPVQRRRSIETIQRNFVVPVERVVPRCVPVPVERVVQRPVCIQRTVPVTQTRTVPYPVDRPCPVPCPYTVEQICERRVPVPCEQVGLFTVCECVGGGAHRVVQKLRLTSPSLLLLLV